MRRFREHKQAVLDTQTGLIWTRDASISEFPLSWSEALGFVEELNREAFNGCGDWKLPNRRELFSLMSHEAINPSLPAGHPFENVFSGYYWTSTSCARLPNQAWYVHLGGARVFKGMKQNSYMVWPVREESSSAVFQTGQQTCYDETGAIIGCTRTGQDGELQAGLNPVQPRFSDQSGWVQDRATGLSWFKDANWPDAPRDWDSACQAVRQLNSEGRFGFHDWRLPGIRELEALTDMQRHSPALPPDHPFERVQRFYWSCTTSRYDTRYAWTLYLEDGAIGVGFKQLPEFYLWPVRGPG